MKIYLIFNMFTSLKREQNGLYRLKRLITTIIRKQVFPNSLNSILTKLVLINIIEYEVNGFW